MSKATSAAAWKGKVRSSGDPFELRLPSGNVCLVRYMSVDKMLVKGVLTDSMLPIIEKHINRGRGKPPTSPSDFKSKGGKQRKDENEGFSDEEALELLKNPERLSQMVEGVDRVVCEVVVEPKVLFHKRKVQQEIPEIDPLSTEAPPEIPEAVWEEIPEDERDEEALYTDQIDLDDKTFIFQFMIGGTGDSDEFRGASGAAVGGVPARKRVESKAK